MRITGDDKPNRKLLVRIARPMAIAAGLLVLLPLIACRTTGAPSGAGSARPPTVDPTYGLPIPPTARMAQGPVPDWIWTAQVRDNQIIYLRLALRLKTVPTHALLYATADDHLQVFINGKQVADTFKGPGDVWMRARKLAVSRYLQRGENIIAIRAKNDTGSAGVAAWLLADDKTLAVTNGRWRVSEHVPVGRSWLMARFNDGSWPAATVETNYGGGPWQSNVAPWPNSANYMAHLYFQPLHVTVLHGKAAFSGLATLHSARGLKLTVDPAQGGKLPPELLLGFGKEVTGYIQVRGSGGAVLVGTGESRGEAMYGPWQGTHRLQLSPGVTASSPSSAFRYATITFAGKRQITLKQLRLNFKYYPVTYRGSFDCSDPLLTKIWYTGAYTAHLCMQEDIWDAPKRDRARWMGDLQVSGETINNVFLDRFLMEQTLQRLRDAAQGGRPPSALPTNDVNGIPGYTAAWVVGLSDFYRHAGDLSYLKKQHALLLSMLRYMKQDFNNKNIFINAHKHWCFCDWAPNLNGNTPQAYTYTDLFDCLAVRRAADMLHDMGDAAGARKYHAWAAAMAAAARKRLADPKTHTFTNLKQVNAMAIYSGVANGQERRAIEKDILGAGCAPLKQVATPYGDNYVLFAIGDLGNTDEGLRFVRSYWGGMIKQGATTFWEAYDPSWPKKHFHKYLQADNNMGYFVSLCHGWSSGVTNWLTEYVLGVRPMHGDFSVATIIPHLGNLLWVRGRVPTAHGEIVVKAAKTAAGEVVDVTLPAGVVATVGVSGTTATINGTAAMASAHGARRVYVVLSKAGTYHIKGL